MYNNNETQNNLAMYAAIVDKLFDEQARKDAERIVTKNERGVDND